MIDDKWKGVIGRAIKALEDDVVVHGHDLGHSLGVGGGDVV